MPYYALCMLLRLYTMFPLPSLGIRFMDKDPNPSLPTPKHTDDPCKFLAIIVINFIAPRTKGSAHAVVIVANHSNHEQCVNREIMVLQLIPKLHTLSRVMLHPEIDNLNSNVTPHSRASFTHHSQEVPCRMNTECH